MTAIESTDEGDGDALCEYANWALETGVWDGRIVNYSEAPDLHKEILNSITRVLFSEDSSLINFQKTAATLAWLGADAESKELLIRDIQELSPNNLIIKTGSNNSCKKF